MPNVDGLYIKSPVAQMQSNVGDVSALIAGAGNTTAPMSDNGVASKNFVGMWTKTAATSGDSRALYWRHYFEGAASGEVLRPWATVNAAGVAAGGTVNGIHSSLSVNASCSVSGAGNAIRATLDAATATRTLGGTCAALQLDSNIGANNTVPVSWSFLRVTDSGSVKLPYFLNLPAASNGTIFAAHTTQSMTHSIKCVDAAGTAFYIMCTNGATNRS
jgi:hypothetical protein